MAKEIKGVIVKGEYLGFYEVAGRDGTKYLYGQLLQLDEATSRWSIVDIRLKNINVVGSFEERATVEIKTDIKELATKDGRPFIVIDAA